MKVTDFIDAKVTYDKEGQYLWIESTPGVKMLATIRGWGAIQNLFKLPHGGCHMANAEAFQDEVGEWVAAAINEKLQRENGI